MHFVLAPFFISIIAAVFSDNQEDQEGYGAIPKKTSIPNIGLKTVVPSTRFGPLTKGLRITKKVPRAVPGSAGTSASTLPTAPTQESQQEQPEQATETQQDQSEETPQIDPLQMVEQRIEHELILDQIAEDVMDEMGIGEWEDIQEDDPMTDFSGSWSHKHPKWGW